MRFEMKFLKIKKIVYSRKIRKIHDFDYVVKENVKKNLINSK